MNNALAALDTILDDVNAVFQGDAARFHQRLEAVGFTLFPREGALLLPGLERTTHRQVQPLTAISWMTQQHLPRKRR